MSLFVNENLLDGNVSRSDRDARLFRATFRDAEELKEKIDLGKYVEAERANPTSLVVVDQFPKPGEQVPLGTPVTLTFMSKDSIPVNDILVLSDAVKEKYTGDTIKKITDDIQSSEEVKVILDGKKEYADMTPTEKDAVKKYVVQKGILESSASDEQIGAVQKDLLFIYGI